MPLNQTNKLVWIVETISQARMISFNDLNEKWIHNDELSKGKPMQRRTFHKWRQKIWDTFGLDIQCENGGDFRYFISNKDDLKSGSIEKWLLNTYSVKNSLIESKSIKERIILEDVPSGREYLDQIIEAMKQNRCINIEYHNYYRNDIRKHKLMPLFVKLFHQRWYAICRDCHENTERIYSLDRVQKLDLLDETFEYPENFSPEEYLEGCFGIFKSYDIEIEHVVIKVSNIKSNYLRALPLHHTQKEIETTKEYSKFTFWLRPTHDFEEELLKYGGNIEVLEPQWFRNNMAKLIASMNDKYK